MSAERLQVVPVDFAEAQAFVERHHRHLGRIANPHKFCVGVAAGDRICGVAMAGLPVSRHLHDGWTLEVRRVATDGTKNACSLLYGACWRAARALGYRRLITYSLPEEGGSSLRAAGWRLVGQTQGDTWDRSGCGRPRVDLRPKQAKWRWLKEAEQHD